MSTTALPRGDVLPVLDDEDDLRAKVIESMRLDGVPLDVRVGNAVAKIEEEATIDGASTLTIDLIDEGSELLASTIFAHKVDVEVGVGDDVLAYRLVSISAPLNHLILTLEDRDVAYLRPHNRPRKASRSHVTMAEFVLMLVREVKVTRIRLWCPELHEKQPIAKRRQLDSRAVKDRQRGLGLGTGESITVKGVSADRAQIRVLEQTLDVGDSLGMTRRVLIGAVMCVTQESAARNLRGGDADSRGAFQQQKYIGGRRTSWPASRDVAKDATGFYRVAASVFAANPTRTPGWCVDQVQRSRTVNTARQGADYDQWRAESEKTVDAYLGDAPAAGGGRPTSVYVKRYWFRRGEPGSGREDTWTCAKRLAEERHWRCFMDRGVMHLASDDEFMRARPRLTIKRGEATPGVASVRIADFDAGKPVAEVELTVYADSWRVPIGAVVKLEGYGEHASGRYLVGSRRGSLLRPTRTVKLLRRRPKLAEPPSEITTRSSGSAADSTGRVTGRLGWPTTIHTVTSGFGQRWGKLHDGIDIGVPIGTEVRAADGGEVSLAGPFGGYGNYVSIDHGGGLTTFYGHLSEIDVRTGQRVNKGDKIALSGNSGHSTGPHLHFGVHKSGKPVDPRPLLRGDSPLGSPGSGLPATQNRSGRSGPLAIG